MLPLRANRYRYSYGLQSELLRTKPLRELSLSVQVNSALPLKSVTCPTHSARDAANGALGPASSSRPRNTRRRAISRSCARSTAASPTSSSIPHRRGDDGYFLLQLTPPGRDGNWQREVLPDGKPLNLVLAVRHVGLDGRARNASSRRSSWRRCCRRSARRTGSSWRRPTSTPPGRRRKPLAADGREHRQGARSFLDDRGSLGWTDLDQAFAAVLKKAPADAQVIYIGDGIVTAGETRSESFVKQLGGWLPRAAWTRGKHHADSRASRTFHAVTVGNTYEPTVLQGIAAVGRRLGPQHHRRANAAGGRPRAAERDRPAGPARFEGRVPRREGGGRLSRPAAATCRPARSRFSSAAICPTGKDQQGEVVVTGKLGSEPVRYAAKIDLKDAEAGNSFIPRLWARAHLDHLLQQGHERRPSATRSSRCPKSSTSSRRTRRCWCWKPTPTASGSA